MSDTETAPLAQKWTERNAAALALVDRLPVSSDQKIEVKMNQVSVYGATGVESKAIERFVAEYAPDSMIKRGTPDGTGRQHCFVEFADGVELSWYRTVTVRIVEDDQP